MYCKLCKGCQDMLYINAPPQSVLRPVHFASCNVQKNLVAWGDVRQTARKLVARYADVLYNCVPRGRPNCTMICGVPLRLTQIVQHPLTRLLLQDQVRVVMLLCVSRVVGCTRLRRLLGATNCNAVCDHVPLLLLRSSSCSSSNVAWLICPSAIVVEAWVLSCAGAIKGFCNSMITCEATRMQSSGVFAVHWPCLPCNSARDAGVRLHGVCEAVAHVRQVPCWTL